MAELLVKAIDATHPDPEKDRRGCYKTGDVVVVMPDGHEWGKEEREPLFFVVKVPGLDVEEAKVKFLQPEYSIVAGKIELDNNGNPVTIGRRAYRIEKSLLPADQKDNVRSVTITAQELAACEEAKPVESKP